MFDKVIAESWIRTNNPVNDTTPYHNTEHLLGVGRLANRLAVLGKASLEHTDETPWRLVDASILSQAGYIHDFAYYPPAENDAARIQLSLDVFAAANGWESKGFDATRRTLIEEIVKYTEFDFANPKPTPPTDPVKALYFKLIRDADQLYATLNLTPDILNALAAELGPRLGMTREEFIVRNVIHVTNIVSKLYLPDLFDCIYGDPIKAALDIHHQVANTNE